MRGDAGGLGRWGWHLVVASALLAGGSLVACSSPTGDAPIARPSQKLPQPAVSAFCVVGITCCGEYWAPCFYTPGAPPQALISVSCDPPSPLIRGDIISCTPGEPVIEWRFSSPYLEADIVVKVPPPGSAAAWSGPLVMRGIVSARTAQGARGQSPLIEVLPRPLSHPFYTAAAAREYRYYANGDLPPDPAGDGELGYAVTGCNAAVKVQTTDPPRFRCIGGSYSAVTDEKIDAGPNVGVTYFASRPVRGKDSVVVNEAAFDPAGPFVSRHPVAPLVTSGGLRPCSRAFVRDSLLALVLAHEGSSAWAMQPF